MSEQAKHRSEQEGTTDKLKAAKEDPGDPLLMGDGLSIDHLASHGVHKNVIAALKKNNINTYGDFRKWSEERINQELKTTIPVRGLAVQARQRIGSGELKRSHDKLNETMKVLNDKKRADAEKRRKGR